jgi:hypothetical protein
MQPLLFFLRQVNRLKVFENRVLRIFGLKRDEIIGGWRKLHNEDFRNFGCSPYVIRTGQGVGRACSTHQRRGLSMGFWWESQKERDHKEDLDVWWENNIKTDIRVI